MRWKAGGPPERASLTPFLGLAAPDYQVCDQFPER